MTRRTPLRSTTIVLAALLALLPLVGSAAVAADPPQALEPASKAGEFTMSGPLEEVQRFRVDVTEAVRSSDGTVTFVVGDPAAQDVNVDSYSKERGTAALRPTLVVDR